MCGRFTLFASGEELAERFGLNGTPAIEPRYNIAPTQAVAVVRATSAGRELALLRWGLIPSWSTDPAIGNKLINARAETAPGKPSFRAAFKQRRCLVPCSGFYEWQKVDSRHKQPFFIRPRGGGLFAFAGLWERWNGPEGETIESCSILTTEANGLMRPLHDRMPVILDPNADALWLDPRSPVNTLLALLVPYPAEMMETRPVGPWVSNPRHEGERCLDLASQDVAG
jgi:putative SOS response-associated peptidase YedK